MNRLSGERGAALVMTLFIIILLMLSVLTLFYMVTNTTKQVTTMEKNIQAEHMADMGIDYVRTLVDNYEHNEKSSLEDYLINELPAEKVLIDSSNRFLKIVLPPEGINIDENSNEPIEFTYTSIGTAFGKEKKIEDTIEITFESGGAQ
ncbi:hypothetical protein [Virgibacillus doumboii]|uniref:hypothetical protein n=1 Tax=Virgibacillus doumboii TaxID=2697503 RepID=UPI0013DF4BCE|nr:hypothetical protein [Virgibacillus doumboii]